jgi:predicted permease
MLVRCYELAAQVMLPRRFREDCGDSLVATFSDVLRDSHARGGVFRRVALCGQELLGLVVAAIKERTRALREPRPTRSSPGRAPSRRFDITWLPRDFRYSVRALAKTPGVACSAALALALGIGATTTMFSVSHGLLRDLPFDESGRLVYLGIEPVTHTDNNDFRVSAHEIAEWRDHQSTLEGLAGYTITSFNLSGLDQAPERVDGARVTANAFDALRVHPVLGRGFRSDEERPGAEPVVILGYNVWENRYGLDPDVLGRSVRVDGVLRTVVGVMPEGFHFPEAQSLWIPLELDLTSMQRGEAMNIHVFGRLAGDNSLESVRVEHEALFRRLELAYPGVYDDMRSRAIPLKEHFVELQAVIIMNAMVAVVSFVLIIACANVANLLLARAASRSREVAVCTALGASRTRIVGQMLLESLVISIVGGVLGIVLAHIGVRAFSAAVSPEIPYYWMDMRVDGTVLLFTLSLVLLSSVIAGTAPALKATGVNVNAVLKDRALGVAGLRLGRLSSALVVGQVALSCGLLTMAGLMVKGVALNTASELSFATTDVLTARVTLLSADYPEAGDRDRFFRELVSNLEGRPGVAAAAVTSHLPGLDRSDWSLQMEGVVYEDDRELPRTRVAVVSPEFFSTLDVRLIEGRGFNPNDNVDGQRVTIVNQRFAERFFPGESPLGRRIRPIPYGGEGDWMTIVGVAPSLAMNRRLTTDADGIYVPHSQRVQRSMNLVVRAFGDPMELVPAIREAVASLDPHLPIYDVNSLAEKISIKTAPEGAFTILFICSGAAALLLAVVGLYGVMAFTVRRRTKEIGIRLALGARTKRILWLSFRGGFAQLMLGLVAGACLAAPIAVSMSQALFDTSPWDWKIYTAIALTLCFSGIAASLVPALRATQVDPMETLRYE